MNFITTPDGREISATNPLTVRIVTSSVEKQTASETVSFIAGAAGFAGKVSLAKSPILNRVGSSVGSFWRNQKNRRVSSSPSSFVTAVVETATSATVTITDTSKNLEQLLETPSGTARMVIELTDRSGGTLYGWIGAITASGNSYVISVYDSPALATQSWVGTLGSFSFSEGTRFDVYTNESSISFTTGTILTREVELPFNLIENETAFLSGLSNGDYAVDYLTGTIFYKKATTGTSDTIGYTYPVSGSVGTPAITTPATAPTTLSSSLPVAQYLTTAPTATNNQVVAKQCDVNGNDKVREQYAPNYENQNYGVASVATKPILDPAYAYSTDISAALEASTVTKATAGYLKRIVGYIDSTAPTGTYYLMMINSATLPADGAVTLLASSRPFAHTNGAITKIQPGEIEFSCNGKYFSTGCVICLSTTPISKTISGAYLNITVDYI